VRWLFVPCFFLSAAAAAADGYPYTDRPLDFSLIFSHHTLALDYGGPHVDTSVDRVGIAWRESFGQRLQLGLLGGYSFLTQSNNPPVAGQELNGYHAGFSLDLDLIRRARGGVSLHGAWVYQKVDHSDGTQQVVITWREPWLELRADVLVGGGLRLYGGVRYGTIDGTQRLSGTLNETRSITETDRTGGVIGAQLELEGNGYIGAAAASGPDRRTEIFFGRRF
jgi:hypothetical protein